MRVYKTTKNELDKVKLSELPPKYKMRKFDEFDDSEKVNKSIIAQLQKDKETVMIIRGSAGCEMLWTGEKGKFHTACFPREETFAEMEAYQYLNSFDNLDEALECAVMDAYTN